MLPRCRCTFFLGAGEESAERKSTIISGIRDGESPNMYPTGLRILIEECSGGEPNIVFKSSVKRERRRPITPGAQPTAPSLTYCYSGEVKFKFLTTCHQCQKRLSPNKNIFMYRGDQGFCSVECRSRQMFLDEMREVEGSTKVMLPSASSSSSSSPCRSSSRRVHHSSRRRLRGLLV